MSAADEGRSLGKLISEATAQLSDLMRAEVALMKAEIRQDVRRGSAGAVAAGLAASLGLLALFPLTLALGFWLQVWWDVPLAIAFLVVGGIYLLIALIAALVAVRLFKRLPKRDYTSSVKESVAVLSGVKPHPRTEPAEGDRLQV